MDLSGHDRKKFRFDQEERRTISLLISKWWCESRSEERRAKDLRNELEGGH